MNASRLFGLLAAMLIAVSQLAAEDIVTLVGSNVIEICEKCGNTLRFPVIPAKVPLKADEIGLVVTDVAIGNRKLNAPDQIFNAKWAKDPAGQPAAVILEILKPNELRTQGTYDVVLEFYTKDAKRVPFKLQVSRPAAKLRVPGTLIIHQVLGLWLQKQETPALVVQEINGRSAATDLQLRTTVELAGPSGPIGARILFPHQEPAEAGKAAPTIRVEPGKSAPVPYTVQSGFPLGKVTGSMEVVSPALTDPVPLNIEVWTRRPLFWIIAFVIPGLVISWFLKVFLQHNLEMEQARLRSQTLLQQVRTDLARRADQTFHDALEDPLTAVKRAQDGDDAAALDTARQALEQAWRAALQELATRRTAAQTALDGLNGVVNNVWPAPDSVSQTLAAAREQVAAATAQIRVDNVTLAAQTTNTVQNDLTAALDGRAHDWQRDIGLFFDQLSSADAGISPPIAAGFQSVAAAALAVIGKAQIQVPASTVQMIQFLHDLSEELRAAKDALAKLGSNLVVEAQKATAPLRNLNDNQLPHRNLIQTLLSSITTFASNLPAQANDPAQTQRRLEQQLRSLQEAWSDALLGQLNEADRAAVIQLLNASKYTEAAQLTADRLMHVERDVPLATPSIWQDSAFSASSAPGFMLAVASNVSEPQTPPALPDGTARTKRQIQLTKFWQSVLSGLLLCLIARYTFADKFVGNFADFVVIFFWAFGLDLTVDSVTKNIPKRT